MEKIIYQGTDILLITENDILFISATSICKILKQGQHSLIINNFLKTVTSCTYFHRKHKEETHLFIPVKHVFGFLYKVSTVLDYPDWKKLRAGLYDFLYDRFIGERMFDLFKEAKMTILQNELYGMQIDFQEEEASLINRIDRARNLTYEAYKLQQRNIYNSNA